MRATPFLLSVAYALSLLGCPQNDATPLPIADAPPADVLTVDTPQPADVPPDIVSVPEGAGARAYLITADHVADLAPGDLASARIGDFVIRNDHVRFVIRGGDTGLYLHGTGPGGIVDADTGDPATDRLQELIPIASFSSLGVGTVEITATGAQGAAEITVTAQATPPALMQGYLPGVGVSGTLKDVYRLTEDARALEMVMTLEPADAPVLVGQAFFPGGEIELLVREHDGWLVSQGPQVSYGLVAGEPISSLPVGGMTLVIGPDMEPPIEWRRWFVVGDGSVSSVVDQVVALRMAPYGTIKGVIDDREATIAAYDEHGLVSRFRADKGSFFGGRLPVGHYTLVAEGAGREPGVPVEIDVDEGVDLTDLSITAQLPAFLVVTADAPMRVTLVRNGGRDVRYVAAGTTPLPVVPGDYTVWASRGFEWEPASLELSLVADQSLDWQPELIRAYETPGWVAADFHLHSEWSPDSDVPLRQRILACVCEGIEYAVATDHDVITDYAPFVADALKPLIQVAIGLEVTTPKIGHLNVWPLPLNPNQPGRGTIAWLNLEWDELLDALGPDEPGRVVQLNHAREAIGMSALDVLGFVPDPIDPDQLARMRFTALELVNGVAGSFDELLIDWLALYQAGRPIAATGVSDSHSLTSYCGHGRTLVQVANDNPATLQPTHVNTAVLSQRTMVTSGPYVTLEPVSPGVAHLRVLGASFVNADTVTLYADGALDQTLELPPYAGDPVRFDGNVSFLNAAAKWAVAVVTTTKPPFHPILKEIERAVSAPAVFPAPR